MTVRRALGAAALVALAGLAAAPAIPALYWAFSAVCQQNPERSFYWLGRPLAVCARCTGIYAGALAAAVFPARVPPALLWTLVAVNALDVTLSLAGNAARFALALVLCWAGGSWILRLASRRAGAGH